MMSEIIPRVSIGLAVFNGGPFLEQALESLLAQILRPYKDAGRLERMDDRS